MTFDEHENLIMIIVSLGADLLAWLQGHQYHLALLAGDDLIAEGVIHQR